MQAPSSRAPFRRVALNLALLAGALCSTGATCSSDGDPPTYAITATVTGLVGAGLTLGNAGETVVVDAAGPLTVTAEVPDGTSYDVTVIAQPHDPDQTCTITNGTGTIHGADAVDIAITCVTAPAPLTLVSRAPQDGATEVAATVTPTLTFSAPIDTATTSSITLTSASGTTAIAISAIGVDVTITPAQPLAPLTTYTLTIGADLRGTGGEQLAAAIATTFTIAGADWGTAVRVPDATINGFVPRVALDAAGDGVMLWAGGSGSSIAEWSSSYSPATGWSAPVAMRAANAEALALAMNPGGAAVATWLEYDGTRRNVWASHYAAATGWSAAELIETLDTVAMDPALAIDGAGNAIAVWRQEGANQFELDIWANRYVAGVGWGTPVMLGTPDNASAPTVAVDSAGNAFAIWGGNYGLGAARYTVGSGWGGRVRIDDNMPAGSLGGTGNGQVVLADNGDATAVYMDGDGTRYNLMAVRYSGGTWSAPVLIEHDDHGNAIYPRLGLDATGAVTAVWTQWDGTRNNIYANRYTVAGGWTAPALVETTDLGNAGDVRLAINANGDAAAIWRQYNGVEDQFWGARRTAGGWGTAQLLQVTTGNSIGEHQIAIDGSGQALAVWYESAPSQQAQLWASWAP
ncbi:MAG: Ig-like domain-containing protein [Deltaproteobacteria bacterium]|nr:Ig-like domain-containing protein [Deltaproteobacteria bacterium]